MSESPRALEAAARFFLPGGERPGHPLSVSPSPRRRAGRPLASRPAPAAAGPLPCRPRLGPPGPRRYGLAPTLPTMTTLYLEITQPWAGEVTGNPDTRARILAAVDAGHITVTTADETGDSPLRSLVAKVQARFGEGTWDRLRKARPDTPEVGRLDVDRNALTWN